jgi:predicted nicotinamide N-methyase
MKLSLNHNGTLQEKIHSITNILINESDEYEEIEKCGVGGKIWKSSFVLSSFLKSKNLQEFINIENKRILEIGAGAGICGLVCSTLNVKKIIITDRDPGCLQLIEKNIESNTVKINKNLIEVKSFDWTNHNQINEFKDKYDIIIGSDLLYSPFMIEPFVKALNAFILDHENIEILLSLPQRGGDDSEYSNFLRLIKGIELFEIKILPNFFVNENKNEKENYDLFENVFTLIIKKKV